MTDEAPIRPTQELHRHHEISIPEKDRNHTEERPARVETQTFIDRYRRRGSLYLKRDGDEKDHIIEQNKQRAEAARRYHFDAYASGRIPFVTASMGERLDRSMETISDRYVAAYTRRKNARAALGDSLAGICDWVCVEDRSAEAWAIARGEHPRFGITLLRLALTVLVKHYGIGQRRAA